MEEYVSDEPETRPVETIDTDFWSKHWTRYHPTYARELEDGIDYVLSTCPVTHSDVSGGYWLVSDNDRVKQILGDWETFSSHEKKMTPVVRATRPAQPPIDSDPPEQREYRHLLNPFLTPKRLAQFEPGIRSLVTTLIDGFIETGTCDFFGQLARWVPGRMLFRYLLGIDEGQVELCQNWTYKIAYEPTNPETSDAESALSDWISELINRRRHGDRQNDIIDGLLHATIDGKPLSNAALMGAVHILILGGFGTTADALTSIAYRLATTPDLQSRLRADPTTIPLALDEFLRIDPPVPHLSRLCIRDVRIAGHTLKSGDRVALWTAAANRDQSEFENPHELNIDRESNRHLSFGLGVHRCVGSNVARMNLRISIEELLSRLGEFRVTPGLKPQYSPNGASFDYLPLSFSPATRSTPSRVASLTGGPDGK